MERGRAPSPEGDDTSWQNRLSTLYSFDSFGNYLSTATAYCRPIGTGVNCFTTSGIPLQVNAATNHYSALAYDAAGNVTGDGRRSLQWPPFMKRYAFVLLFAACAAPPPPAPTPAPPPPAPVAAPQPAAETAIGSGRVNASTLNVRNEPSLQGDVIGHARRGERVTILGESGEWIRVRTGSGEVGWVSSQHVARDGARRGGCPPDSDYRFIDAPRPSFNEGGPHGVVTIEASVNAQGTVTSTKVVSNTTGADAFATIAAREVTAAKFAAPVRNCVTRAFIFTYRRAF